MRRVVVTGMGIVSSIGNNTNEVLASLREAKSGVVAAPEYAELGFRCQVHAPPQIDWESMVDRRAARFLAQGTASPTSPWNRRSPTPASRRPRSPTRRPA
jgi:3-oxoacyl-[acyl-carrier-protein] synthase-1